MLFLMSLVVFAIVYFIPGDPVDAMLGQAAECSAREAFAPGSVSTNRSGAST
jgi:ABC-type dipeptide/oligopeptide/nickel transport system permease component